MAKGDLDRAKADLETHQIGPKKWLHNLQVRGPLEGQKGQQTRQGERVSPPSDFSTQKQIQAIENPLNFSG